MAEYINRHSIRGEQIADLWKKHAARYEGSLGRIADARDLLIGAKRAPLPEAIASLPDGEAFRVDTAQKYTAVMQLVNMLSSPDPRLKRPKTATSDDGEKMASRIEKFINPAVRANLSNRDLTELLLIEAEAAAIVVPELARWRKVPGGYYEDDGETIKPDFQRSTDGKTYDDALEERGGDEEKTKAEFEPDEKHSRAAYDAHVARLRARNYPFDIQLVSRQQMVPINPVIKGPDVTVDGIITRTRLSASDAIKRKYLIDGLHEHTEPTDEGEGDMASGNLWLYSAWLTDQDDDGELYPYVSYSLAGKATTNDRRGFDKDAVIDFRKQCGLRSLPVAYGYGWRWFTVNPDKRAIPYTMPFGRSWLAVDSFLTGKAYAGWSEGMLAWFMQMPDTVQDTAMLQAWMEFTKTSPLTIEPFKILPVWGKMIPAQHPGTGRDVGEMVAALQGSNQSEVVNPLARGGGDATSAIERSVVAADTVAGVMDVKRTVCAMTRRIGELTLEVCCGVSRTDPGGKSVLIYGNPDTPVDQGPEQSTTRAIIELKPNWLGPRDEESFDLVAYYPKSLSDNLAEKAQVFGFYKEKAITFETWCDEIGVEDPERYRAQLIFDQWINTPEGMQVAMKDAAQYLGDKELVDLFDAQKKGATGPNGQPIGMVAGLAPPMGPQALPPGMPPGTSDPGAQAAIGMQNPAASQMAAIAGAARNADAVTARPAPPMGNGMMGGGV
jgi:hypothetical protein